MFSLVITTLFGCADNETEDDHQEPSKVLDAIEKLQSGTIIFDVEFPFFKDEKLKKFLPKTYTLSFKDDEMYGEMNSYLNIICNKFYSDNKSKLLFQTLDNSGKKYQSTINENSMEELLKTLPEMVLSKGVKDTTVLGIKCKKAMAEFKIDSVPGVELIYTDEIKLTNPNWLNQYSQVDGFLLGYDIEQFGMRMRLRVKEIKPGQYSAKKEDIYGKYDSKDFKSLTPDELQKEFQELVKAFDI